MSLNILILIIQFIFINESSLSEKQFDFLEADSTKIMQERIHVQYNKYVFYN